MRKIKIGIDVGGTFTHAVAINADDVSIVGKSCVKTSHKAKEGVARGVVESMRNLINEAGIHSDEVVMIAHSTTQATNALLEGDVATVGILVLGRGVEGRIGFRQINRDEISLAPGKQLAKFCTYIDLNDRFDDDFIKERVRELIELGAEVIAISMVYGVDNPEIEKKAGNAVRELNVPVTVASEISKLYGLRVRTRTAVINAAMMPRMLETANMTEKAVRESGIDAPLMIMRSDGGIMDITEMRKRPILTMLSGPAAGIAAALMYARVSDGIFIEVGGTSSDISIIRNGKPQVKSAQIGGNRLYLRALDVRTLGIAGGSVPRIKNNKIIDMGPRSAHIADVGYVAFEKNINFKDVELGTVRPLPDDPDDYLTVVAGKEKRKFTLTPTGASHFLGLAKKRTHSDAVMSSVNDVFQSVAGRMGTSPKELAGTMLSISAEKIKPVIKQLIREYKLDESLIQLVGGGGGAPAIVPYTAQYLKMDYKISDNTEVISAIGVALGIIQDSIEKTVLNPTPEDILNVRSEAMESVQNMGADPASIEVMVEVDAKNKRVIATATGSGEMRTKEIEKKKLSRNEIIAAAAKSLKVPAESVVHEGNTSCLHCLSSIKTRKRFLGIGKSKQKDVRIVNPEGVIKLQQNNAVTGISCASEASKAINELIEELTTFGDAGALMPDIFVCVHGKIIDMTGLITREQMLSLLDIELKSATADETVLITGAEKR